MWIKVKDIRKADYKWVSDKVFAHTAYLPVNEFTVKQLQRKKEKGEELEIFDLIGLFVIVSEEVDYFGNKAVFSDFSIVAKEREESLLDTLKEQNLTLNSHCRLSFAKLDKICFEVDGNILSYDEFCRYELPEGMVFKRVFDNGFSYISSEPFQVSPKHYAESAANAAGNIGYIWVGWRYGFRLNDIFCIDVCYGRKERYSEVSNT